MTRARAVVTVATATLVGGLLAGGLAVLSGGTAGDPGRVLPPPRVAAPDREPPRPEQVAARSTGSAARPNEDSEPPTRIRIDAVDVDLPVVPMGVDGDGLMALPRSPFATSWYRFGADPTDRRGAVVVSGHVDTAEHGVGPLARLAGLAEGIEIVVDHPGASTTYAVTAVRQVDKALLDLPDLFRRTGPPRLHLVTCGGAYLPDRGGYQANVVVVAVPVR